MISTLLLALGAHHGAPCDHANTYSYVSDYTYDYAVPCPSPPIPPPGPPAMPMARQMIDISFRAVLYPFDCEAAEAVDAHGYGVCCGPRPQPSTANPNVVPSSVAAWATLTAEQYKDEIANSLGVAKADVALHCAARNEWGGPLDAANMNLLVDGSTNMLYNVLHIIYANSTDVASRVHGTMQAEYTTSETTVAASPGAAAKALAWEGATGARLASVFSGKSKSSLHSLAIKPHSWRPPLPPQPPQPPTPPGSMIDIEVGETAALTSSGSDSSTTIIIIVVAAAAAVLVVALILVALVLRGRRTNKRNNQGPVVSAQAAEVTSTSTAERL